MRVLTAKSDDMPVAAMPYPAYKRQHTVGRVSVAPPGFAFKSTTRSPIYENATFYLLDNDATVDGLSAVEQLV